jgi:hypothetical protein
LAVELSLSRKLDPESELLRPSEMLHVRQSFDARFERAAERTRERRLTTFRHEGQKYEGREVHLELPPTATRLPYRSVTIRQGVPPELIAELSAADPSQPDDRLDERIRSYAEDARIAPESDGNRIALTYGDI